ncbi:MULTISPECIES: IclR family transcriptional regulator [unclassified Oceanispirochaeta]|uniref:IclR family transcriptional regulator n=1 Tax=unclassified Oceanispirochaeta TaxID=2635722 RepID=UPI000E08D9A5|nr:MULTISPECIES: IclR family transcriptional regulator [unclassified Oceanispirochaeta]MBF9018872.1 IclR family transcriptional regulator [Oceanispirochaeta sp. M2]NPD75360.1 IclR family transcriptional regulator [Oceanispirochaeta sp. M1]RDG28788.1 IclR family transcriptional regulator [Oceanispirochaeta sp. M1]
MAVQILDKSFLVLETLSRDFAGLSVSELSKKVDLNITTVHRILGTFSDRGYIQQDRDKRYSLSQKFIELSSSYLNGLDLKGVAGSFLKKMSSELQMTVFLATLMDNQAVYIDRHDSFNKLRRYTSIGERKPLYCTALGKSLLLGFSTKDIDRYIENCDFERFTETTVSSREQLLKDLETSSIRGWSVDYEEVIEGIICFAAPIYDYRGHIIAAMSTSINKEDMNPASQDKIINTLIEVSRLISEKMGYRPSE